EAACPERSRRAAGRRRRVPVVEGDRLPGLVPGERAHRNVGGLGADVAAEGEQAIEELKELDVPRDALRDRELSKRRVRVDEHLVRDASVLVAPEPRAAGQVDEQVGARRVFADRSGGGAVVAAVGIYERPRVAEAAAAGAPW